MSPRWKSRIFALAALIVFAVALLVLKDSLANVRWSEVQTHIRSIPAWRIAAALGFCALSYLALTRYDALGIKMVGSQMHWPQLAPTAFMAYAFAHNLGASAFSGGALRLREYTRAGLSVAQVGGIMIIGTLTFTFGVQVCITFALLWQPEAAAAVLKLPVYAPRLLGAVNVMLLVGYLVYAVRRAGRPYPLAGAAITGVNGGFVGRQLLISLADLSASGAALYVLLPHAGVGFPAFMGFYVLAMAAGILSSVPGGIGVFESVLVLTLPSMPPAELLGGILVFRVAFYLLPFLIAVVWLALREIRHGLSQKRNTPREIINTR